MSTFAVEVTPTAAQEIRAQAAYILEQSASPECTVQWLHRVRWAIESLTFMPHRGAWSREAHYIDKPVRQILVASHRVLYTVDDQRHKVIVVGFRHGRRQRQTD